MTINYFKILAVVLLVLLGIATTIQPIYPQEQILQHIGTFLLLIVLVWDIQRGCLSPLGFAGVTAFTALHIIGVRWIYSYVPYVEWVASFGWDWASESGRNHYDRLVHFCFGLMLLPAFYDLLYIRLKKRSWAICVGWLSLQVGSLIYELFEWGLTYALSPQAVEGYNGQQGDMWDAHKDMALALLGSTITALAYWGQYRIRKGRDE